MNMNKIAKSITYSGPELPGGDDFIDNKYRVDAITGTGMIKNPFFKVAKKKKKKKKK